MTDRAYSVYIMASRRNGTIYVGVTNNLGLRAHQHRTNVGSTFTAKYDVKMLAWVEHYGDVNEAIAREKQLKKWERKWKLALIEAFNPQWRDFYEELNALSLCHARENGHPGATPACFSHVWIPAFAGMTGNPEETPCPRSAIIRTKSTSRACPA